MLFRSGAVERAGGQADEEHDADDTDRDDLKARIDTAISGGEGVLWLTDDKGKEVAVPAARLAFVELGPAGSNPIGFG